MIFKLLQSNATVRVWLYEQLSIRIEGKIRVGGPLTSRRSDSKLTNTQGFDEFMNLVIDDAVEVKQPPRGAAKADVEPRKPLGQILLKGDNVSLIQSL
ncbi:LSM domain-containing protein [Hirsutella rhossiliensis]